MRIPSATYRLQFTPDFGFKQAQEITGYLARLGISGIYASPIFAARSGSQHGYDVVDQNRLNPELGTEEDYEALVSEAQKHGLSWLQDIVPNHMAFSNQNPYLMDALEHGPDSAYGDTFDIDWTSFHDELKGRVLAPMLGADYRQCLEGGELQLIYGEDGLKVGYYSLQLPISLTTYSDFLGRDLSELEGKLATRVSDLLKQIDDDVCPLEGEARSQASKEIKRQLWLLFTTEDAFKNFVETTISVFNGEAGSADSFTLLDSLLGQQFYRLSHWKVASEMLNYRRFFTVNELICLNAQHSHVFDQTHGLIQRLVKEGKITGLRIDHIDGLYDPLAYLKQLTAEMGDVYTVVEKILEADETLPDDWPIQGTSGYEFLTCVNRVFCQSGSKDAFGRLYEAFTGVEDNYEQLFLDKKRLLAESELVGDIDNLAHLLNGLAGEMGASLPAADLRLALKEVMIAFPVYRSYVSKEGRSEKDEHYIKEALATVRSHSLEKGDDFTAALDFVEKVLLLEDVEALSDEVRGQRLHFIMRMQQFTGPLTAKGIEDTLFYVYNRFTSLNEVGGAPGEFALPLSDFHAYNQHQQAHWPHNLNASSTHDTKRSEDVRSRLNVLSEMPEVWEKQVNAWKEMNADKKRVGKRPIPTPNDEYFLYQTLVGAYPFDEVELSEFRERIKAYVLKAGREAKENTNWTNIDEAYEEGYASFIETLLDSEQDSSFLDSLRSFQSQIKQYGVYNSISQLLLKIASPGIPDFYQGSEMWDLSLVDPDNRRPVDYDKRAQLLEKMQSQWESDPAALVKELMTSWEDGRIKLFLIFRGLAARKGLSDLFEKGQYLPLEVTGKYAERVIAFARQSAGGCAIAVIPRFLSGMVEAGLPPCGTEVWDDTAVVLPEEASDVEWKNWLTDATLSGKGQIFVGEVLDVFPVGLLSS